MTSILRCYLCFNLSKYCHNLLCEKCYHKISKLHWINCVRCGHENCYGCERLIEFDKVFSILPYSSGIPEILVLAKDQNSYNAQLLFYEMFFLRTKNYLKKIIIRENYNCIVLPTLRRERILTSHWHPIIFFDDVLKSIKLDFINKHNSFNILQTHFLKKSLRQALIPSKIRNKCFGDFKEQEIFIQNFANENNCLNDLHGVLILDDVLTTGETSIGIKKILSRDLKCENWGLLTLFRAHQKKSSKRTQFCKKEEQKNVTK